jgi:hypothetical protein
MRRYVVDDRPRRLFLSALALEELLALSVSACKNRR